MVMLVALAKDETPAAPEDVVLIHGVTEDRGLAVLRKRNDKIEPGVLRNLEEGKPIVGEVVRLKPRKATPLLCDVEVELTKAETAPPDAEEPAVRSGNGRPAQVATEAYRKNWDSIYKRHKQRKLLS